MLNRNCMWLALVALCCFILACSGGGGGGGGGSNDPTVTALEVTPANASIAKGTTQDLTVTGILSDSTHHDMTASVTWSSSDVGVATISEGVATATGVGATTITATLDNVTSNTTITVTDAELVSIEVTPTNPGIVLGTLQQFTATGTFSDSTTQDLTTAVTWSSSSPGTATISNAAGSEGSASSVATGTTTITATLGSVSGMADLTVIDVELVFIEITPADPSMTNGETLQFIATATYSDGSTYDITQEGGWSSSSSSVVRMSNAKVTKGLATAQKPGSVIITMTLGSISGTTTVTVSP